MNHRGIVFAVADNKLPISNHTSEIASRLKHFKFVKVLGKGGYGQVFEVIRRSDGRHYAMKTINISSLNVKDQQRAIDEIRYLSSIKHPYIVAYYEAFFESGKLFIVMEYAENGDLHSKITSRRQMRPMRRYSENLIFYTFIQILLALKELHRMNIIHRDIKSSNIFIASDNTIRLGDLGVSKLLQSEYAKTLVGTPYFQSPEIWMSTPYNTKIDIYSLACVIYEMASFAYPFDAKDYKSLGKKVMTAKYRPLPSMYSSELNSIVEVMLSRDPNQRPSADELLSHPFIKGKMQLLQLTIPSFEENEGGGFGSNNENGSRLQNTIRVPKEFNSKTSRIFPTQSYPQFTNHDDAGDNDDDVQDVDEEEEVDNHALPKIRNSNNANNIVNNNNNNNNAINNNNALPQIIRKNNRRV